MRAVISGYYGQGNGGDEALLMTLLQMLPSQVEPIVLSANPQKTQKQYGVKAYGNRSGLAILEAIKTSNIFIWGGGSLMQDVTSLKSPIYYAGLMALAQKKGLKTIAWAQGIGPLNNPFTRWLTHQVLLGCNEVSVRDYKSAELVSKWHINPLIAPDPVWALNAKSVAGLADLPAPKVAVNLRRHSSLTTQRLKILTQALIDFQKATNTCILLVPFQASQDLEIARSIAKKLPGSYQVIQLENPRELKGVFKGVEMTIGMRLHSLIMAASEDCKCFALSYDPKVDYLMEEIEIPGWNLDKLPDDPNIISTAWLEYFVNGEPLLKDRIQSLRDRAFMHQEILKKLIIN
ncbi:MAG: polysaccharide pyruvyl transferase CsaB [Crocosphaera sp.]|nr:polysaccharide pyruvyl transferase CsaB [Crocosphaera sp.]